MRFLLIVHVPTEAGNKMMKDPSGIKILEDYLEKVKPEAAYFSEDNGERTFYLVVDLSSADMIPSVAEPLFNLGARVEIHVAMVFEDLKKAFQR